jgi:hypothetical protein
VHKSGEVLAPAEQVWDLICDWAGILRWWLPADQGGETRRIHYTKSDDQAVTGYLATTYVDDLDRRSCVVHISSQFDVTQPAAGPAAGARFESIYLAMFDGYRRYFSRLSPGR